MFDKCLYDTWRGMVERCTNPSHISYPNYGAKGVTICDEWKEDFHQFCKDMGPRPDGHSIDRADNTVGYSKENCRWASIKQQNNNKSDTRHMTFNGKTMNMAEWAKELGTSPAVLHYRLAIMKLSIEDALSIPVTRQKRTERFGRPRKIKSSNSPFKAR